MAVRFLQPSPPLSALVETIWDVDAPPRAPGFDRMLPSARAQLVINLAEDESRVYDEQLRMTRNAGAALDAPSHRSFLIDTAEQARAVGVVFRAGAAAVFFRERMDALANTHVDLDDLVPGAAPLRARLLGARDAGERLRCMERWLLQRIGHGDARPHAAVSQALALIDAAPGRIRIPGLAAGCGMAPRRFGALFREQVGMSPKRYARLQRFHGVVAAAQGARVDWAGLAADGDFHDQAHLAHEFRAFCGMSPGAWLARRDARRRHVALG